MNDLSSSNSGAAQTPVDAHAHGWFYRLLHRIKPSSFAVLVGSIAIASLIGIGFSAAALVPRFTPASSPAIAAEHLVKAVTSFDMVELYNAVAPSELNLVQAFTSPSQGDSLVPTNDANGAQATQALLDLQSVLTINIDHPEYSSVELASGLTQVDLTAGSITVEGKTRAALTAIGELYTAYLGATWTATGVTADESAARIATIKQEIIDHSGVGGKFSLSFDAAGGLPLRLIAVQEGSGWYISPLLSIASALCGGCSPSAAGLEELSQVAAASAQASASGDTVVPANEHSSASERTAINNTLNAATNTGASDYWQQLAATLPLAEQRLISLYGEQLASGLVGASSGSPASADDAKAAMSSFISGVIAQPQGVGTGNTSSELITQRSASGSGQQFSLISTLMGRGSFTGGVLPALALQLLHQ